MSSCEYRPRRASLQSQSYRIVRIDILLPSDGAYLCDQETPQNIRWEDLIWTWRSQGVGLPKIVLLFFSLQRAVAGLADAQLQMLG